MSLSEAVVMGVQLGWLVEELKQQLALELDFRGGQRGGHGGGVQQQTGGETETQNPSDQLWA